MRFAATEKMRNELLLFASVVVIYGCVLLWFRLFGTRGLQGFTVFATLAANIEVLLVVDAFGLEQTLGNVLFASTFLVTDILSEVAGKEEAKKAVHMGIAASILFLVVSQSWLLYQPSASDWAYSSFQTIFSVTPRTMLASLLVYAISQRLDVWLYHRWWQFTEKRTGSRRRFLWLRNNGSTLISQLINTVLFTVGAFWGMYPAETIVQMIFSTYIIYIATSLLDTPVVYLARRMHEKRQRQIQDPAKA